MFDENFDQEGLVVCVVFYSITTTPLDVWYADGVWCLVCVCNQVEYHFLSPFASFLFFLASVLSGEGLNKIGLIWRIEKDALQKGVCLFVTGYEQDLFLFYYY